MYRYIGGGHRGTAIRAGYGKGGNVCTRLSWCKGDVRSGESVVFWSRYNPVIAVGCTGVAGKFHFITKTIGGVAGNASGGSSEEADILHGFFFATECVGYKYVIVPSLIGVINIR